MSDSREIHLKRLREAIKEIAQFKAAGVSTWSPSFIAWRDRTLQSLEVIHGKENGYQKRLKSLRFDQGRNDLDPRLSDPEPNTFEEDFQHAERLIHDAIEEAPEQLEKKERSPRTLGDPSLMAMAQRLYGPQPVQVVGASPVQVAPAEKPDSRKVFVVHGRNKAVASDFFTFLRALGLHPIEWGEAVALTGKASPYVGEVLDIAFQAAQAVAVLMTPDDEVRLSKGLWADGDAEEDRMYALQARPNVLFEAGMAIGRDPVHTLLVQVGKVKKFSDVGGRHILHLGDNAATRHAIAMRLQTAGCPVALTGDQWLTVGNFHAGAADATSRKVKSASRMPKTSKLKPSASRNPRRR